MSAFSYRLARNFYLLGCFFAPLIGLRIGGGEEIAQGLSFSDGMFASSFGIALVALLAQARLPKARGLVLILVGSAVYAVASLASTAISSGDALLLAIVAVGKFVYITSAWFLFTLILLPDQGKIRTAVFAWTLGCAVSGLGAIAQVFIDPAIIPGTSSVWGRATGFTGHPNDLGASLGIAFAPALAMVTTKRGLKKLTALAVVLLIVAGMVLSASASGILSAAFAVGVWIVLTRRFKTGFVLVIAGVLFVAGIGVYLGTSDTDLSAVADLYALSEGTKAGTLDERFETFRQAMQWIQDSPVVGIGTKTGGWIVYNGLPVHNVFLSAWYESGIFGALGIVVVLLGIAVTTKQALAGTDRKHVDLIAALVASEVAFLLYSMTAPGLFQRYGWISVALVLAIYNTQRRQPIRPSLHHLPALR